jgi:hypothetical protein
MQNPVSPAVYRVGFPVEMECREEAAYQKGDGAGKRGKADLASREAVSLVYHSHDADKEYEKTCSEHVTYPERILACAVESCPNVCLYADLVESLDDINYFIGMQIGLLQPIDQIVKSS